MAKRKRFGKKGKRNMTPDRKKEESSIMVE